MCRVIYHYCPQLPLGLVPTVLPDHLHIPFLVTVSLLPNSSVYSPCFPTRTIAPSKWSLSVVPLTYPILNLCSFTCHPPSWHTYPFSSITELFAMRKKKVLVAQSCPTLCDPMACMLPGSSIHGIFQARILEWVAISVSRGFS